MQIKGLILFKSSTDQAIASLYFLRICSSFCSFSSVKSAAMITGFDFFDPKKAYFRCLGDSFKIRPSKFFSSPCTFSSLLIDFSILPSFKLNIVSLN